MKRCPTCARTYSDERQNFCLDDGAWLVDESVSSYQQTAILPSFDANALESQTKLFQDDPSRAMTISMSGYRPNSIAVLPFAHLSSDADDEYFCDGLAEELINELAQVDGLKVVARTSAFSFKGKNLDVSQIGKMLNVKTVLEGSVRRAGKRLRINVQLINAEDGYHIWSERYDREMKDIFELQDEITVAVVTALKLKLLGSDADLGLTELIEDLKDYKADVDAYQLYLRGRFFLHQFTPEGYYQALDCFQNAAKIDPKFADAHAGVADAHIWLTELGPVLPHNGMPKAKEAALQALALDPELSEACTSLAIVLQEFEYDFVQAESQYRRAIGLNPNNSMALQFYGALLAQLGRFCEAETNFRTALELDPLSTVGNWIYPFGLFLERRYDEAIYQGNRLLGIDPNFSPALLVLSFSHHMKQDHGACVENYTRFLELCALPEIAATSRAAFDAEGWQGFLRAMTVPEIQDLLTEYISAVYLNELDETDAALQCLQQSYDKREGHLVMLNVDPRFDNLRADERFQALIKAVGFPN
jgi:adenylate cyclase